jgi:hypothetical protein
VSIKRLLNLNQALAQTPSLLFQLVCNKAPGPNAPTPALAAAERG